VKIAFKKEGNDP